MQTTTSLFVTPPVMVEYLRSSRFLTRPQLLTRI